MLIKDFKGIICRKVGVFESRKYIGQKSINKSSRLQMFYKIGLFFFNSKENMCLCLFNNVAGFPFVITLKQRLQHRCFSVDFAKFLGTFFCSAPANCFYSLSHVTSYLNISKTNTMKNLFNKLKQIILRRHLISCKVRHLLKSEQFVPLLTHTYKDQKG